jgi:hypothetical protein
VIVPVILGVLTLLHAIAKASDSQPASRAPVVDKIQVIDKIYAGLVYAYGFAVALVAPITHTYHLGAPIVTSYAPLLGLALGVLSWFIWRGMRWAMIVVCALVTAQWLVLASLDPVFWANSFYSVPAIAFAILTIASIAVTKVRAT